MIVGCVPAHALYFSSYEFIKYTTKDPTTGHLPAAASALAGAVAVTGHDMVMTPLDTIKQRLQLGHYQGNMTKALSTIIQSEGYAALYRSFPITLATNVPYGAIMVSVNEFCKEQLAEDPSRPSIDVTLASSSVAGFLAAAVTTPLDRIKTLLQTQRIQPACFYKDLPTSFCPIQQKKNDMVISNWKQAVRHILAKEGWRGLFQGMTPRVLSHTPAVAISWTTYEVAKAALARNYS